MNIGSREPFGTLGNEPAATSIVIVPSVSEGMHGLLDQVNNRLSDRFVQQALSNAYRHADGSSQAVIASCDGSEVEVSVVDERPGLAASTGTSGLSKRIESLGGAFEVYSMPGKGARLTARFDILPRGYRPERSPLH